LSSLSHPILPLLQVSTLTPIHAYLHQFVSICMFHFHPIYLFANSLLRSFYLIQQKIVWDLHHIIADLGSTLQEEHLSFDITNLFCYPSFSRNREGWSDRQYTSQQGYCSNIKENQLFKISSDVVTQNLNSRIFHHITILSAEC
jgi:hypothetical protein